MMYDQNNPMFDLMFPTGLKKRATLDPLSPMADVVNEDGSTPESKVLSIDFGDGEVLIPTVHPDGYVMALDEAVAMYQETGGHYGIFDSPEAAAMYAEAIAKNSVSAKMRHKRQGIMSGSDSY